METLPWEKLVFLATDVVIVGLFLYYQDRKDKANAVAQEQRDQVIRQVSDRCHTVSQEGHSVLRDLVVEIKAQNGGGRG